MDFSLAPAQEAFRPPESGSLDLSRSTGDRDPAI